MSDFLSGLYAAFSMVAIVFLMRFWRESRDQLFAWFAAALLLLMLERLIVFVTEMPRETGGFVYVLRLIAFALIIWAMVQKNRKARKVASADPGAP